MLRKILQESEKGLTLVEMFVTLFIFSIIFTAASGLFVSAIKIQSRALASQQLLNQTTYLMEYMSRAIRMAKKDDTGNCTGTAKLNYVMTASGIKFKNYHDECQEFYRDCGTGICKLKERKDGAEYDLTSPILDVTLFNIGPSDSWDQSDVFQPRVTIFLEIKKSGLGIQPKIRTQTTISQREIDIQR